MRYSPDASITGRAVEWLNNSRARYLIIAFGDQAQFVRRDALPLLGGFPDLMLMEDVECNFSISLGNGGAVGRVSNPTTSPVARRDTIPTYTY
jgi:hypothetical protein